MPLARWSCLLPLVGVLVWSASGGADEPKPQPEVKRVPVGKSLFLETQGEQRRVIVASAVNLRECDFGLEGLLTRKNAKEHEYILVTNADARLIHAALLVAGGEPGSPVRFDPKFQPPRGGVVKITLRYQKDGKTITVPAREWIRHIDTGKDLDQEWIFAGSRVFVNPEDPECKPFYGANDGDLICVCHMELAMLDLIAASPKKPEDRVYRPHSERIPPIGTPVEVILEPVKKR
jgi:hypothetical protein